MDVPLGVTTLELTREKVSEPALEEGDDSSEEEEPDAPSGSPESDSRTLADGTRVEASVDLRDARPSAPRARRPHKAKGERKKNSLRA